MPPTDRESLSARARGMRAGGRTLEQIAKELGVGRTTVWRWCNPKLENGVRERPGIERILAPEPLWYLKGVSHSVYIQSDHWRIRRERFIESLSDDERCSCARCGVSVIGEQFFRRVWFETPDGRECGRNHPEGERHEEIEQEPKLARFDVHHLTYERVGEERDEDLELICNACHNLEHYPESRTAIWWRDYLATHPVPGGLPLPASALPGEPEIPGV